MRVIATLLASLIMVGCSGLSDPPCKIDPQIFCEPYARWKAEMPPDDATKLRGMSREDLMGLSRNFGTGVRNEFGLWQVNPITELFRSCGVDHPDNMSQPFTLGFIAYLNVQPADMCELGRQALSPEPPPPPPGWEPSR